MLRKGVALAPHVPVHTFRPNNCGNVMSCRLGGGRRESLKSINGLFDPMGLVKLSRVQNNTMDARTFFARTSKALLVRCGESSKLFKLGG